MTKQQKEEFDNLYNFSETIESDVIEQEETNKKKAKDREKRIKQRKAEQKTQFDLDTETVIGMTNKNNQKNKQQVKKRMTKQQAKIERKKKKIKKIIKLITLLLLIVGGVIFALVSPIFDIKEIKVLNYMFGFQIQIWEMCPENFLQETDIIFVMK